MNAFETRCGPRGARVGAGALLALGFLIFGGPDAGAQTPAQETVGRTDGGGSPGAASHAARTAPGVRAEAPTVQALRATTAIPEVDGYLDDPVWQLAEVARDFVQYSPSPGDAPSQATEVRILYTDDAVYVAARMFDTAPDSIISRLARRDQPTVTDMLLVAFDSYLDRRTAFVFGVSVAGVQRDLLVYDDVRQDDSWNAVWDVKTRVDELGWTAEYRIPLSQLRFSRPSEDGTGTVWGVNFQREIARLDETSLWSPRPADGSRVVSAFGNLVGLDGIVPSRNLELRPYLLTQAMRAPGEAENPFFRSTAVKGSLGGDLRYGITNSITLNATINPDFGQVEADPAVVNLGAFETFFPEKRPFFLEGADIFRFGIGLGDQEREQLFYSRRLGRRPQGFVPRDAVYADFPEATTILGAAKVSGKTSGGWSLGFLDALTGEASVPYQDASGDFLSSEVEPLTNYAVGRAIKNFRGGETAVGGIFTATNRSVDAEGPLFFLPSAAYSGGLDFRHRFGNGDYQLNGYLLGSHVRGNPDALAGLQLSSTHYFQRPDASHVEFDPARTSLTGTAASLEFGKTGGGKWRWGVIGNARSPGFDVNAIGFQQRADRAVAVAWTSYDQYEQKGSLRNWSMSLNGWSGWSFGGERIVTGWNANGNFQLTNFWGGYAGFGTQLPALSPTALRGGPGLSTPPSYNSWFGFFSDSRKPVRVGLNANFGGEWGTGSDRFSLSPNVTVQPSSRVQFSIRPRVSWSMDSWQYVTTRPTEASVHYVHGRIDRQTVAFTTRLNYTFSPRLSLQLYAEPFVSAGSYDAFKEVDDPRASAFDSRFHTYAADEISRVEGGYEVDTTGDGEANFSFGNPDFNVKSLRSNLVFRWEYRPGSTIFLVWSQDRGDFASDGSFSFGRDFGDLFGAPSTNIFLIKVEHWLGF